MMASGQLAGSGPSCLDPISRHSVLARRAESSSPPNRCFNLVARNGYATVRVTCGRGLDGSRKSRATRAVRGRTIRASGAARKAVRTDHGANGTTDRHAGFRSGSEWTTPPIGGARAEQRVLVVAPQPFLEDRGTPIAVRYVVLALRELGYAVDILTYPVGRSPDLPDVRLFRIENPFAFRSVPVGLSAQKLVLDALLVPALWKRLRTERYACVHAVEEAAFPAVILARRYDVPVIYDMQSSLPEQLSRSPLLGSRPAQFALRRVERWLLERADQVISSAGLAAHVRNVAPGAKVREWSFAGQRAVPEAGAVARLREQLEISPDARVVLYAGTFEAYQGLDLLLASVSRVRAAVPEAVFILVGASRPEPLRIGGGLVRSGGGVRIVPRQPRDRMAEFMALADVVVSPRVHGHNAPLKIFDYLAAGRPIVATDIPPHRAVLDDDRALLVPPEPEAFGDGIVRLLRDTDRARRLAEAGLDFAREHLSWNAFVRSIDEVYASVCGRARGVVGQRR